jgi:hypothetical protein
MPGDYLPDDLKNLWQELSTNPVPVSIDGLRGEMGKLRKGLRRRFAIGGGVALLIAVNWALFFFIFPNFLQRIGSVMTVGEPVILLGRSCRDDPGCRIAAIPNAFSFTGRNWSGSATFIEAGGFGRVSGFFCPAHWFSASVLRRFIRNRQTTSG